ncbi:T9SS type A sorting domain-containing protein [candidate division KSB1 bacterium]|nr:T9SS type A sorting domain-containing protein [candidate division KSB1 bacterium]
MMSLANTQFFIEGSGTPTGLICSGIEELCNYPNWGRRYSFDASELDWHSPAEDLNTVVAEVTANRPMVYVVINSALWQTHAVTLIGYGYYEGSGAPQLNKSSNVAEARSSFYICHDNNLTTGEDVMLFWDDVYDDCKLIKVHPGGGSAASNNQHTGQSTLRLHGNYPNPFNPKTEIHFEITQPLEVTVQIYNVSCQFIRTIQQGYTEPGAHVIPWNGQDQHGLFAASGIYFGVVQAGEYQQVQRMALIK